MTDRLVSILLAGAALLALAAPAAAGTVTVTDPLTGWNDGAPLLFAAGGTYVETGVVTVSASGHDVLFDASAGDLVRQEGAPVRLAVRYEVRRGAGPWSTSFGRGLGSAFHVDPNVSGAHAYTVRATITDAVTARTPAGAYAGTVTITLIPP